MKNNMIVSFLLSLLLCCFSCKKEATPEPNPTNPPPTTTTRPTEFSQYVTVTDGTKLATTVYLPEDLTTEDKVPTILVLTRYGRIDEVSKQDAFLTNFGYAVVTVDVRGSSASFGKRPGEYSPTEVLDAKDIVQWAVEQDWCDGNIGAYGVSYTGTTAELLAATQHPAVKAVIPGWSDFDIYNSPVRPYGAIASGFLQFWSDAVSSIDMGEGAVKVDSDTDGALLQQAIAEHRDNPNVFEVVKNGEFKDSKIGEFSYIESGPLYWKAEIEASKVPMLVFASWLDAASAEGAIRRFQNFSNPQKLILMPDNHGAGVHASPYQVANSPLPPSMSTNEIGQMMIDFFDTHLKGVDKGVDEWPNVRYYNFSEETYLTSDTWPLFGVEMETYYFKGDQQLNTNQPTEMSGQDRYEIDYTVSTGQRNRWITQLGAEIIGLHDRGVMDEKMLTYTSAPLTEDVQISGTPVISLKLSATHDDGLVLVYLEDVDENGQSRYVTEGGLRLLHNKEATNPNYAQTEPYHSFLSTDAAAFPTNEMIAVNFQLLPTSVKIKAGHRIRIAIAGADQAIFDRIPESGNPSWVISRSKDNPSFIELPIIR